MWYTEGPKDSPSAGTVLADSGPLTGEGRHHCPSLVVSAENDANVSLQLRNAANTNTKAQQGFALAGRRPFVMPCLGLVEWNEGERFRVVTVGAVTGQIQASMVLHINGM